MLKSVYSFLLLIKFILSVIKMIWNYFNEVKVEVSICDITVIKKSGCPSNDF